MSFYPTLSALLVTFFLIRFLLSNPFFNKLQDMPNERSLHSAPVPRIGGVGVIVGVLCGWALLYKVLVWWLVLPVLLLSVVSLLDDARSLPVKQRLLAQIIAAAAMVFGSDMFAQQGVIVAAGVLLFVVWMTNLYNFMDGSDGLAGGMAFFGFGMYGIAAWLMQNPPLAWINFCIVAAAASFLSYNFYPAKIFMGDSGSIPLGFLAAAIGVWGWQQGSWAWWFPLMVFSPFIVDASVTLLKRSMRGVKITEAHREHYYQRLIQMGWGHRNVALAEYGLMLAVGVSALWMLNKPMTWPLFVVWGSVYAGLMLLVDIRWKNFIRGKNV